MTKVSEVVFIWSLYVFLTFYVIPAGFTDEKSILEILKIFSHGKPSNVFRCIVFT